MTDTEKRLAEVEACCREVWGVLLLAASQFPDDKKLQAAFQRADAKCKRTGLMAREGMRFIEPANGN